VEVLVNEPKNLESESLSYDSKGIDTFYVEIHGGKMFIFPVYCAICVIVSVVLPHERDRVEDFAYALVAMLVVLLIYSAVEFLMLGVDFDVAI
jgi:hypothetical protein